MPLVKSHIIPESFFRDLREKHPNLKMVSSDRDKHPKKCPNGVYDQSILCRACEDKFQVLDDYAAKVLINNDDFECIFNDGELIACVLKNIDMKKIKLFFMSVLWRASISNHDFYNGVSLGKLEEEVKKLIWNNDSGGYHEYSFFLAKFDKDGTLAKAILKPIQERWFGIRYYRFYMGGYVLYIKADSRDTPESWRPFIMDSDGDLVAVSRGDVKLSKEYMAILKIAKSRMKK